MELTTVHSLHCPSYVVLCISVSKFAKGQCKWLSSHSLPGIVLSSPKSLDLSHCPLNSQPFTFLPLSPIILTSTYLNVTPLCLRSSPSGRIPYPISGDDPGKGGADKHFKSPPKIANELGEESEPEPKASITKHPDSEPPKYEDEWEKGGAGGKKMKEEMVVRPRRSMLGLGLHDRLEGLKRVLVDTVYGTDFGFRASAEMRAEVSELVAQLEAAKHR